MSLRATQTLSIAVLSLGMLPGWGQIVLPVSHPASQDAGGCPSFNSSIPSAASERCTGSQRSGNLLDDGKHFLLSLGSLGGHDSAFNARPNLPASFEGGMVYAGLMSLKQNSFSLFENTTSWVNYGAAQGILEYVNSTSLSMTHMHSPRTTFSFAANNVFGNDAIRILPFTGNDNVEQASYGIHPGRVIDDQATARLSRQSTETRWWAITVRNNFRDFIDDASRVNTLHARAEVQYQPSPRAGIGVFEETSIETGTVNCTSQSVGLVYERRFSETLAAEVAAAPAVGTKGCIDKVSANLYGAFSAQPWRATNLYLSAFRKLNDSGFNAVSYENNALGGWIQKFGMHAWSKAQAGWLSGTAPLHVESFSGTYYSGTFGRALPAGFTAAVTFQRYNWSGVTNVAPTRTILMGSLNWSPSRYTPEDLHGPMSH